MANTPDDFARAVNTFGKKAKTRMDTIVRKATLKLYSRVVEMTPVDKGFARANWQFGVEHRAEGALDRKDYQQRVLEVSAQIASEAKAGGVNYLANNLPYIERLEYGYSNQAPNGMARLATTEAQAYVNILARGRQ